MERLALGPCLIEASCCTRPAVHARGLRACLPLVAHITWRAESVALRKKRAQTELRGEECGLASGQARAVVQFGIVESYIPAVAVVTQLHCLQTTPGVCLCLFSRRQPIKQRSPQHQCQHWWL